MCTFDSLSRTATGGRFERQNKEKTIIDFLIAQEECSKLDIPSR